MLARVLRSLRTAALTAAAGCSCPCVLRAQAALQGGAMLRPGTGARAIGADADSTRLPRAATTGEAGAKPATSTKARPSADDRPSGDGAPPSEERRPPAGTNGWSQLFERSGFGRARTAAAPTLGDSVPRAGAESGRVPVVEPGGHSTETRALLRRDVVPCAGQPVSDVVILTQPPYTRGLLGRFDFVAQTVRQMHAVTRPEVVRRFLVIEPGQPCDELRRAESERILRAQPFLVDARILAYDDGQGGVRLEVETRDEFSLIVGLGARTAAPPLTRLRVGEANLMGAGVHAMVDWTDGRIGYRDEMGGRLTHYQFLGRPYQLNVQGLRRRVGGWWDVDVSHPFYTDLQRFAWRATAGETDELLEFRRSGVERNALSFRRRYGDIGGLMRLGVPGRLSLFGFSLSMEEAATRDGVLTLSDTGIVADARPPALGFLPSERFEGQSVARVNALWGLRSVRFVRVTGFEALTGAQDVRRGFQLGTVLGRGLGLPGMPDDDIYVGADLYAGLGSARSFAALEAKGEGRRDHDRDQWNGVVTSGRAAWYLVPDERNRVVASVEYAGAWKPQVPTQFALGAREGGLRGFAGTPTAGAQRVVARLEHRLFAGRPFNLGDLGFATFVDAGRVWAGEAPWGVTTPLRASVGIGLLAAVPPRSRRLWRVDVALPITREPGANGVRLVFSNRDLTRMFFREPRDVEMVRQRAVPSSIFNWP